MSQLINGLHHITALGGHPQTNVDFYSKTLGLRLVKKTINFDATDVYHLYYGDETGQPGTIMTFFPYPGIQRGRIGTGQVIITSFSIPNDSIDYWARRLEEHKVSFQSPSRRGDETVLPLEDPEGLLMELVAGEKAQRKGWGGGEVPEEHAIRGFFGVTICVVNPKATQHLLTNTMEYSVVSDKPGRIRLQASNGSPGSIVDLACPRNAQRG
ncbi:MAG: VOC family protein [Cyclobacteriaceae bacterium]